MVSTALKSLINLLWLLFCEALKKNPLTGLHPQNITHARKAINDALVFLQEIETVTALKQVPRFAFPIPNSPFLYGSHYETWDRPFTYIYSSNVWCRRRPAWQKRSFESFCLAVNEALLLLVHSVLRKWLPHLAVTWRWHVLVYLSFRACGSVFPLRGSSLLTSDEHSQRLRLLQAGLDRRPIMSRHEKKLQVRFTHKNFTKCKNLLLEMISQLLLRFLSHCELKF